MKLKLGQRNLFYVKDVDMRFSFAGLQKVAKDNFGDMMNPGDVVVFDNRGGNRRKIMYATKLGFSMHYQWNTKPDLKFPKIEKSNDTVQITNEG